MSRSNGTLRGHAYVLRSFTSAIHSLGGIKTILPIILHSDLETGDISRRICDFVSLLAGLCRDEVLAGQFVEIEGPRVLSLVLKQSRRLNELLSIDLFERLLDLVGGVLNPDLADQVLEHLVLSINLWSFGMFSLCLIHQATVDVQVSYFRLVKVRRFKQVNVNWVLDGLDRYYTADSSLEKAKRDVILLFQSLLVKDCTRGERSRIVECLWSTSDSRQLCEVINSLAGSELAETWRDSTNEDLGVELFCRILREAADEEVVFAVLKLWSVLAAGSDSREMLLRDDESFQLVLGSLKTALITSPSASSHVFESLIHMSQDALGTIKRVEFLAVILYICSSDTTGAYAKILDLLRANVSNIESFSAIKYHLLIIRLASKLRSDSDERNSALAILATCALRKCRADGSIQFIKEIAILANDTTGLLHEFLRSLLFEVRHSSSVSPGAGIIVDAFVFIEHVLLFGLRWEVANTKTDVFAQVAFPFDTCPDLARDFCEVIALCLSSKSFEQVDHFSNIRPVF
jgi:hypothetical protein